MNIKKVITIGIVFATANALALDAVEVTGVKARQRYPWNGLVDIDFTLDSKATEPYLMKVTAFDNVGKTNLPVKTVYTEGISFAGNPCMVHKDTSRIVWNAAADLPNGFKCSNALVSCQDVRSTGVTNLYMIVDLSSGPNSDKFPVTYTNCPPSGGWTEEHMTTKLVLRRVEPSTFIMGSANTEEGHQANETQHKVTLTKPYYIGIYELTAKQFALIYGGEGDDTQPIKKDIGVVRGFDISSEVTVEGSNVFNGEAKGWLYKLVIQQKSDVAYSWPSVKKVDENSIMGKLRSKTNLTFDLPTEAQWENACRAGSALALNIGETNSLSSAALISGSAKRDSTGTHYLYVGNYMPNALGLYDMQGNVDEWCLDAYQDDLGSAELVDPDGGVAVINDIVLSEVNKENRFHVASSSKDDQPSVMFDNKVYHAYSGTGANQPATLYLGYTGRASKRVIRGGNSRAAYRTSATSVNTSGTIFTTGVIVGVTEATGSSVKVSYTNPLHGVRVALTVDE